MIYLFIWGESGVEKLKGHVNIGNTEYNKNAEKLQLSRK